MRKRLLLALALVAATAPAVLAPQTGSAASDADRAGGPSAVPVVTAGSQGDDEEDEEEASEPLLDLAAMVLRPDDLPEEGYAVSFGESRSLTGYADLLNGLLGGRPGDLDEVAEQVEETGWRQWYGLRLSLPNEDDPDFFGRSIVIDLAEHADEDGAEAGYDLLTEASAEAGYEETSGGHEVGDRSVLVRYAGTAGDSTIRYKELALVFQTGIIVAVVTIIDFRNDAPPASEAAELGDALVERIERVLDDGSAGLGPAVLRVDGEGVAITYDYYRYRDGAALREYGETERSLASIQDYQEEVGRTDLYVFQQSIPSAEGEDQPYNYLVNLHRYEDEDAAAAWVDEFPAEFTENPAPGYSDVELIDDAESFGDQSALVSFDVTRGAGAAARGYQYYVRVGEVVAVVQLNGIPDAPLDALDDLTREQVECLEEGTCGAWAEIPASLGGEGDADGEDGDRAGDGDGDGAGGGDADEAVEVALDEVDDSGVRGEAILRSAEDEDETEAEVGLRGGEEGMLVVVQGGTCDDLDPRPVSDLVDVDDDGEATLEIPLSLEELLDEEHALAVYAGEEELDGPPVACGEIAT